MRRGKWGLREQTEIVDNVDNSVYNLFLGMFSVVNYVDNLWTRCL